MLACPFLSCLYPFTRPCSALISRTFAWNPNFSPILPAVRDENSTASVLCYLFLFRWIYFQLSPVKDVIFYPILFRYQVCEQRGSVLHKFSRILKLNWLEKENKLGFILLRDAFEFHVYSSLKAKFIRPSSKKFFRRLFSLLYKLDFLIIRLFVMSLLRYILGWILFGQSSKGRL